MTVLDALLCIFFDDADKFHRLKVLVNIRMFHLEFRLHYIHPD
jgi:hypothetical protein